MSTRSHRHKVKNPKQVCSVPLPLLEREGEPCWISKKECGWEKKSVKQSIRSQPPRDGGKQRVQEGRGQANKDKKHREGGPERKVGQPVERCKQMQTQ